MKWRIWHTLLLSTENTNLTLWLIVLPTDSMSIWSNPVLWQITHKCCGFECHHLVQPFFPWREKWLRWGCIVSFIRLQAEIRLLPSDASINKMSLSHSQSIINMKWALPEVNVIELLFLNSSQVCLSSPALEVKGQKAHFWTLCLWSHLVTAWALAHLSIFQKAHLTSFQIPLWTALSLATLSVFLVDETTSPDVQLEIKATVVWDCFS